MDILDIKIDLEQYDDEEIVTFHRERLLSQGEFISEMRRRSFEDDQIVNLLQLNNLIIKTEVYFQERRMQNAADDELEIGFELDPTPVRETEDDS